MPRKKRVRNTAYDPPENSAKPTYLKHNITEDEKTSFVAWSEGKEHMGFWDWAHEMADSDYKLSLGYDGFNKTFQASLTNRNKKSDIFNFVLVARAPTVVQAAFLLWYKFTVLLGGDMLAFHESDDERDAWG